MASTNNWRPRGQANPLALQQHHTKPQRRTPTLGGDQVPLRTPIIIFTFTIFTPRRETAPTSASSTKTASAGPHLHWATDSQPPQPCGALDLTSSSFHKQFYCHRIKRVDITLWPYLPLISPPRGLDRDADVISSTDSSSANGQRQDIFRAQNSITQIWAWASTRLLIG